MRDSHSPALRSYGYVVGLGLQQDLVAGRGRQHIHWAEGGAVTIT